MVSDAPLNEAVTRPLSPSCPPVSVALGPIVSRVVAVRRSEFVVVTIVG